MTRFRDTVWTKKIAFLGVLLILLTRATTVSADHEVGHYEFTLEEEYYDYVPLDFADDEGVQIYISTNQPVDIFLLTPQMFESCCASGTVEQYQYLDDGTELRTDDYQHVIENGEGPKYLIIDHTSINEGGANPSGSVSVELYLVELPENLFEFHWQNFMLTLLFLPLSMLLIAEAFKPGTFQRLRDGKNTRHLLRAVKSSRLPMTYGFMIFNTLLFILRIIFSPEDDNLLEYVEWGAMASGAVADGNFFSILSSNFFHFSLSHLVGNMFAIYILGRYLEPKFGSYRFLGVLVAGGVLSSVFSLFYDPYVASGGASGMVFCAFGVVLMEWILDKVKSVPYTYCQWHDMQWFWGTMIVNALVSFVPGISLLGHLGGLVGGMGAVYLMVRIGTYPEARADQLIHCKPCGFVFPVLDASVLEVKLCPKCGLDFDSVVSEEE